MDIRRKGAALVILGLDSTLIHHNGKLKWVFLLLLLIKVEQKQWL